MTDKATTTLAGTDDAQYQRYENQIRAHFAMEILQAGEWDLNLNDNTAHRSLQHDRIFGYDSLLPEWTYDMFLDHVVPEDRERVDKTFRQATSTGKNWDFECRIIRRDKEMRWIRAAGQHYPQGDAGRLIGVVQDITDRKRADDALGKSESQYRSLFEYAPYGILIADPQSFYIDANPAVCQMLGYTRQEMIGMHARNIVAVSEVSQIAPALRLINAKSDYNREWQFRRKDGSLISAEVTATVMPDGNLLGIVRDISERKRADEAQATLAAIVESSDDAIIGKTLDGTILTWNDGARRIFGYTAEEAVGRSVSILFPPDRLAEETNIQEKLASGQRMEHYETVRMTRDGRKIDVSLTVSPIKNAAAEIVGASKIARDITARKKSEEAMAAQAAELARSNIELERFAHVASHDLQEPMRTVQSFAAMLERNCADKLDPDSQEYLSYVVSGVKRMQSLILALLEYSRVSSAGEPFSPVNVNEVVATVLANLHASIEAGKAQIIVDPLPVVTADATQLGQVFQNLLANAIKFCGKRPPRVHISVRETPGEWVFSVADGGIGIASEYFDRIFIIFQRLHTIEEYAGTGIGLAICKKIVERHGGQIWLNSVVGEGSTFHFSIPKREKAS